MPTLSTRRVRVWDLPTRVFHVLLALSGMGLVITGEIGGDAMGLHFWFGYAVLSLVLFRLVWGCVGGHWSRFASFVPTPARLWAYLAAGRRQPSPTSIGHNPLGALSVMAMLLVLLLQVFSGFMSDDEIAASGPWAAWVPNAWVSWASEYHTEIGKLLLMALVILHVGTVLFYKYFRQNDLISPMVHGDKWLPQDTPEACASRDSTGSRLLALVVWAVCAAIVYGLVHLAG